MAGDYIFKDPQSLNPLMESLLRHWLIIGTYDRVLKYRGRSVRKDGQSHQSADPELLTKVKIWHDGMRVCHYVDNNSVKFYHQQNVLKIEMTMNDPQRYLVHRWKENDDKSSGKKYLPMGKGRADINIRA